MHQSRIRLKLPVQVNFRETYANIMKLQEQCGARTGLSGPSNSLFVPPFDDAWNNPPKQIYKTRYGPIETPKIQNKELEKFYFLLLNKNRSIYEEFLKLKIDTEASPHAFYAFVKNVIQKLSFEGECAGDPRVYPISYRKQEEVSASQRKFLRSHLTKHQYNVWTNIYHQTDSLFLASSNVDLGRRLTLTAKGPLPKSLIFFLLQRYTEVLEHSAYFDRLREMKSYPSIEELFYEQCVRDISTKGADVSLQFIVERITDIPEAHYYYLIHLRESLPRDLPDYCHFQEDKLFEELSQKELKRVSCSHTIFRNFYLIALMNLIPVRAAKCFDCAVQSYFTKTNL